MYPPANTVNHQAKIRYSKIARTVYILAFPLYSTCTSISRLPNTMFAYFITQNAFTKTFVAIWAFLKYFSKFLLKKRKPF